jgi:hypothetical protein
MRNKDVLKFVGWGKGFTVHEKSDVKNRINHPVALSPQRKPDLDAWAIMILRTCIASNVPREIVRDRKSEI